MRLAAVTFLTLASCGTYSALRPADNLRAGQAEVHTGLAANAFGEVLPVGRVTVGVHDRVELGAQYEIYSALGSARFGLLRSEDDGVALSLGVVGGYVSVLETIDDELEVDLRGEAAGGTLSFGRRWDSIQLYLTGKAMAVGWAENAYSFLGVSRLGIQFQRQNFLIGFETGGTLHHVVFIPEATAYIGLHL